MGKATEDQYRKSIVDLEQSEREKINATMQGSAARLAAIDGALKEEQSKNLQDTSFYRELLTQRVEIERKADEDAKKATADAGKEEANNIEKMGALALAAQREHQQLTDSARRITAQKRLEEEIENANAEYAFKLAAMNKEMSTLDKTGKDYENKLRQLQDKQKQLVQQHENDITAIKEKAAQDQNQKQQAGMTRMVDEISGGLTQVLMRHQSFASMMDTIGNQVVSGMMQTALKSMMTMDMDKERQAASAARSMFLAGAKFPFPANIVMAPALGALAFASMMAFQDGTDSVPGMGRGDHIPAMLEPGEGVVPER